MKFIFLIFLLLCFSCAIPKTIKKDEITPSQICYQTTTGITVIVAAGIECLEFSLVDDIANKVALNYNTFDHWKTHALIFINEAIDCGGVETMGCTWLQEEFSVVSLWPKYRTAWLIEHELTHQAIYYTGNNRIEHYRLDHPEENIFNKER